jgi:predicted RNA-binding protein YlqC (UPF0109 family)
VNGQVLIEWLLHVIAPLVADPGALEVRQVGEAGSTILVVRAAEADLGRIIGREGAIRQLARAVGGLHHRKVFVNVPGTHAVPPRGYAQPSTAERTGAREHS